MGGVWKLEEARYVQARSNASNVNDESLVVGFPGPPANKFWTIISAYYMPDVAETQTVSWEKRAGSLYLAVLNPISLALNPCRCTFIEQGMEYILLPGEYMIARRAGHTVGSTMAASIQFIESDLPLYSYEEPQVVKRTQTALSTIRQRLMGGGPGRGGGAIPPIVPPGGRGGGGPLAV